MIQDRNIDPDGLTNKSLGFLLSVALGTPALAVSATAGANIHTSAGNASYTAAAGTQPDAPRNVFYQMSCSSTVAFASCSGTLSVAGVDINNRAITETIALSSLAAADTNGIQGSKVFGSIAASGITRGAFTLTSAAHAQSNNVSFYLGGGPWLGLPAFITNPLAIRHARVGTSLVTGITNTAAGTGQFSTYPAPIDTVNPHAQSGIGRAAIMLSAGVYATNKPVTVWFALNGKP